MNKIMKSTFEEIGAKTGLKLDEATGTLIGVHNGYHFWVYFMQGGGYYAEVSVAKDGQPIGEETMKNARKSIAAIKSVANNGYVVTIHIKGQLKWTVIDNVTEVVRSFSDYLELNEYEDVCQVCGKPSESISSYNTQSGVNFICDDCHVDFTPPTIDEDMAEDKVVERTSLGAVGAILGSLIGVAAIIFLYKLGYVAVAAGLIMGVCTIGGYVKFGKRLSTKGIIIGGIIMAVMIYLAVKIYAIMNIVTIANEYYDVGFWEIYRYFWELIVESGSFKDVIKLLGEQYLFSGIGAIIMIVRYVKLNMFQDINYKIQ